MFLIGCDNIVTMYAIQWGLSHYSPLEFIAPHYGIFTIWGAMVYLTARLGAIIEKIQKRTRSDTKERSFRFSLLEKAIVIRF